MQLGEIAVMLGLQEKATVMLGAPVVRHCMNELQMALTISCDMGAARIREAHCKSIAQAIDLHDSRQQHLQMLREHA